MRARTAAKFSAMKAKLMNPTLVAWGRAVKARNRRRGIFTPPLWLFTDEKRLPDPRRAVARLPPGLCGVLLRHDADPNRARLARDLAQTCRARRLTLVIAGDPNLAASCRAGLHLRGGKGPCKTTCLVTSSAHNMAELVAAHRRGAACVFLSPAFATASHPGQPALGALRWAALARQTSLICLALGGIDGTSARRLPRHLCRGAAAIGAWF